MSSMHFIWTFNFIIKEAKSAYKKLVLTLKILEILTRIKYNPS